MNIVVFYTDEYIKKIFSKYFLKSGVDLFEKENVLFVKGNTQDLLLSQKNKKIFEEAKVIAVHVSSRVDRDFLKRFKKLELIACYSTGVDHVDLNFCKKKGIRVENVSVYGAYSVAQSTTALLLNISSSVIKSVTELKKQKSFILKNRSTLRGFELKGKTVGIIGTGNIGKEVIKMLSSFGVKIIASDIKRDQELSKEYDFTYVSFEKLIKDSDIISLHIPLCKETKNIISAKVFAQMKKGVVLINTSRGGLIETKALLRNIKNKKIKAFGGDVLAEEENIFAKKFSTKKSQSIALLNKELLKEENAYVTPHNAYNTDEAVESVVSQTVDHITQHIK